MATTILVPTDFSSNALMAAHYALNLARERAIHVHILHAHYPLNVAFRTRARDKNEEERLEASAMEQLERFVETLGGVQQELVTHSLVTHNLVDAVKQYINEHPVSLVVMGTHGASGRPINSMGSSTYDVAKNVHVPLLVVPENTNHVELNKVVFFTNYQDGDVEALRALVRLVAAEKMPKCTLVHILGGDTPASGTERQQMQKWRAKLERESGFVPLDTEIAPGKHTVEAVNNMITALDADLTLLTFVDRTGFFERLFHKSLAKAIVLNPKIPVLLTTG